MKHVVIIAALVSAFALGACRKEVPHGPLKLGAGDIAKHEVAR